MALASGQNKISYDVSASTTVFAFPYKYWETSDLVITKENKTTGLITELIVGTDYSIVAVNGDPDNGASITLNVAIDDHTLVIERIVPLKSDAAFTIGDGIPPESLNQALDKLAAQTQQLDEQIGRQVIFPVTDPAGLTYELPAVSVRASKVAAFDSNGSLVVLQLAETGSFAADSTKGIDITANVVSCKVDDTSIEFDNGGNISIKDLAISTAMLQDDSVTFAKMAHLASMKVIGNVTGSAAAPAEVSVLDEDDMASDSDTALVSQQSLKAYVDAQDAALKVVLEAFQLKYSGATVFPAGAMPTTFTDLDLSPTIGAIRAMVTLSIEADASADVSFRTNGETKVVVTSGNFPAGISMTTTTASSINYITLMTDAAGVVEWDSDTAGSGGTVIKLLSYQKLN